MQAFREWSLNQSRPLSNPPAGTELASRLARFPCEVQRITGTERLDSTTAGYLSAWANIECLNLAHGLFRDSIPAALASALPVISQALVCLIGNCYTAVTSISANTCNKTPRNPKTKSVSCKSGSAFLPIRKTSPGESRRLHPPASLFREHLARLDKLCSDRPDKDNLSGNFADKRYASPGAPLPDAVFEDKNGQEHRLTEFAGKYIYIDLWASWCAPCVAEVPTSRNWKRI